MRSFNPGAFVLLLFAVQIGLTAMSSSLDENRWKEKRDKMVFTQIERRGIKDSRVLKALRNVPREKFVPLELYARAFEDGPLPIGKGQTISQPYIVAYMTELAQIEPTDRVLEIGTGSGYQTAVLAELSQHVYTVEIVAELAQQAKKNLLAIGYKNISFKTGDGYQGWREQAPFDVILVTAAALSVPEALKEQLNKEGRLIIPVELGVDYQVIQKWIKMKDGSLEVEEKIPVRFVPLVHPDEESKQ